MVTNWNLIPFVSSLPNGKAIAGLSFFGIAATIRSIGLAYRLKSKMLCIFRMGEPGCVDKDVLFTGSDRPKMDFYRIKVKGRGHIHDFGGRITFISGNRSGEIFNGENLDLTPAFNGISTIKDIRNGTYEYLDVLYVSENSKVQFCTAGFSYPNSSFKRLNGISSKPDQYEIHVTVTAPSCPPVNMKLLLNWTGVWKETTIVDITNGDR